ncbi:MAG: phosphotransferase [bacterium]
MKLNAFILAAGFGQRLRPISSIIPKPLFPLLGRPLIAYVLDKLLDLPVEKIGINLHHLGVQVQQWVELSTLDDRVRFFPEDPIMGTGGALYNAREFLKEKSFIVHNSDVLCNLDIRAFYHHHRKNNNMVTLAVHNVHKYNQVGIDEKGKFMCVGKEGRERKVKRFVTFTGIALYEPEFLGYLPDGFSPITETWCNASEAGEKIGTFDVSHSRWRDMGTIDVYVDTIVEELSQRSSDRFIGPDVHMPIDCQLKGIIVLESGCSIEPGARLENCIVLPGGVIKEGEIIKNSLVYQDKVIPLTIHRRGKSKESVILGSGGSDRLYTRIRLPDETFAIKLKTFMNDPDLKRQIEYTKYFKKHKIPVPEILSYDLKRGCALFEDLGDIDLFTWFHRDKNREEILHMYRMILNRLISFQLIDPTGNKSLRSWVFDYETFLWESEYFLNRFIKGYLNINVHSEGSLREEFKKLARKVDSYPKIVIHRDFQSQNIMLRQGEIYFIDFQGARIGPPAYDAVSLIFDPYCPLEQDVEQELCEYYIKQLESKASYNTQQLRESLFYCRFQRHMQALGAYGYLSKIKGKEGFESFIPRAVKLLLQEATIAESQFPQLAELLSSLLSIIGHAERF